MGSILREERGSEDVEEDGRPSLVFPGLQRNTKKIYDWPHEIKGTGLVTLNSYIQTEQFKHPRATGEFTELIRSLQLTFKVISNIIKSGEFLRYYSNRSHKKKDSTKIQDIVEKTLIEVAYKTIRETDSTCMVILMKNVDEMEVLKRKTGKYLLSLKVMSGLENFSLGLPIATVFGLYISTGGISDTAETDALQPGKCLLAAGYAIYGASTMVIFTLGKGNGVKGFILDSLLGEFVLVYPNINIPSRGKFVCVDSGKEHFWTDGTQEYLKLKHTQGGGSLKSFHSASLVLDFHKILFDGGILISPTSLEYPDGEELVLCEVSPIAKLCVEAGGLAETLMGPALEIVPSSLYQVSSLYLGSKEDVIEYLEITDNKSSEDD